MYHVVDKMEFVAVFENSAMTGGIQACRFLISEEAKLSLALSVSFESNERAPSAFAMMYAYGASAQHGWYDDIGILTEEYIQLARYASHAVRCR